MMGWGLEGIYLISRSLVGDIFRILVDVVHGVGHGWDVVFGCTGDGVVCDVVCHFVECLYCMRVWKVGIGRVCCVDVVVCLLVGCWWGVKSICYTSYSTPAKVVASLRG